MMRIKPFLSLLLMLLVFGVILGGCTRPPVKEMEAAKAAIDDARAINAALYAPDIFPKAQEAMDKAQQAFDAKKYKDAKKFALTVVTEANVAIELAKKNMESAREEANRAIDKLESVLAEAFKILENRRDQMSNELEELKAGLESTKKAFDFLEYKKATEKAAKIAERANSIIEKMQ